MLPWALAHSEASLGVARLVWHSVAEMSTESWKQISDAPSSAMGLYFSGKLKVSGNAMLATKLQTILQ